jgi:hypothetical protein
MTEPVITDIETLKSRIDGLYGPTGNDPKQIEFQANIRMLLRSLHTVATTQATEIKGLKASVKNLEMDLKSRPKSGSGPDDIQMYSF